VSFVEGGFTHGGNGLMKQVMREMLASGFWTIQESIGNRAGELAAAPVAQSTTRPVTVNVTGLAPNTDIQLPICMLGANWVARKNFSATVTQGVDYTIDRIRGTIQILNGGVFVAAGVGTGNFTLDANFELMRGWIVLKSTGISTQETIYVGMEFDTILNSQSANPVRSGASVAVFTAWTNAVTSYSLAPITARNKLTDDVLFFVKPNIEGVYQANISKDRVLAFGETDSLAAWFFAGALARFRPIVEQPFVTSLMGNTAGDDADAEGPVGDTNQPSIHDTQTGSCWLYDLARFADTTNPVELNANHWTFESSAISAGVAFTPSEALLNSPAPGAARQYYFELHDVMVGRNTTLLNNQASVLYGMAEGLKTVLIFDARHNLELTLEGVVWRLWRVGSSPFRFVAVSKS